MNIQEKLEPVYTLEFTKDEYATLIAMLFIPEKSDLTKHYGHMLSQKLLDKILYTQHRLREQFNNKYKTVFSSDIINELYKEN